MGSRVICEGFSYSFVLEPEGLQMDEDKVWVVQNWPRPHRLKNVVTPQANFL